jgi:hypothetical protein
MQLSGCSAIMNDSIVLAQQLIVDGIGNHATLGNHGA